MDAHPSLIVPQEASLFLFLYAEYNNKSHWNHEVIDLFIKDAFSLAKFRMFWGVDQEAARSLLYSEPELDFKKALNALFKLSDSPFATEELEWIGDKNPVYCHVAKLLLKSYPNAKFIHLVRDYRACVESMSRFESGRPLRAYALHWVTMNKAVEEAKKIAPDQFLTINYEDFVFKPEKELSGICNFLSIPYDPAMLDYYDTFQRLLKDLEANDPLKWSLLRKVHPNLLKPMNTSRTDRWRSTLTPDQIKEVESAAANWGLKYGYEPASDAKPKLYPIVRLIIWLNHQMVNTYYRIPLSVRRSLGLIGDTKLPKRLQ
jgi:hypothetical protein